MRPGTDRERIGGGARVSLGISFSAQLWARPDLTEGRPCSIRLAARAPLEAGREHVADERPQLPAFAVDTQAIVPAAPGSGERRHGELWSSCRLMISVSIGTNATARPAQTARPCWRLGPACLMVGSMICSRGSISDAHEESYRQVHRRRGRIRDCRRQPAATAALLITRSSIIARTTMFTIKD